MAISILHLTNSITTTCNSKWHKDVTHSTAVHFALRLACYTFCVMEMIFFSNFVSVETDNIRDYIHRKQNRESTERYSKSIVRRKKRKIRKKELASTSTYASPIGTGPGVRRSKRPLSACYTRRICSMEISQNSVKGRVRYTV